MCEVSPPHLFPLSSDFVPLPQSALPWSLIEVENVARSSLKEKPQIVFLCVLLDPSEMINLALLLFLSMALPVELFCNHIQQDSLTAILKNYANFSSFFVCTLENLPKLNQNQSSWMSALQSTNGD